MRKIVFGIAVLSTILILMSAFTIDKDALTGVFKGSYIQSVTVPDGWQVTQGGFKGAVIERKDNRAITMTVNTFQAETEMRFIENIIAEQIENFNAVTPEEVEVFHTGKYMVDRKKHIAHIRYVYGAKPTLYQAIAYIGEVGQIVTIAMMCEDELLFHTSLNDFKLFVESYAVYREDEYMALNAEKTSNSSIHQSASPVINNRPSKKTFY
jgi:hypothetical protein